MRTNRALSIGNSKLFDFHNAGVQSFVSKSANMALFCEASRFYTKTIEELIEMFFDKLRYNELSEYVQVARVNYRIREQSSNISLVLKYKLRTTSCILGIRLCTNDFDL